MRTAFRLDICDPLIPATGRAPLAFSFEQALIEDERVEAPHIVAEFAVGAGYEPWGFKGLLTEDGLRTLARAALATAEELRETKKRMKEEGG